MKLKTCLFFMSLGLFLASSVYAQTTIKSEVDKTAITTDDTLAYKLIIVSSEKNVPAPIVPKFEGFDVISQAQSSTISFVKEGLNSQMVYAFILAPKAAGKLKIEPARIKVGTNSYESTGFDIDVTQGKKKPQAFPQQKPAIPESSESGPVEPQTTL